MKRKNGVTVAFLAVGTVLTLSSIMIAKKEISDYKNIGTNVTYNENIKAPIEDLVSKFISFDFAKEPVNCEEIICNKDVADKYNSVFNSTVKYNLNSELLMSNIDIKNIVKEPDDEYKVEFHREFEIKFDKETDTISAGSDEYTAYVVEKDGKFYIDRILNDVPLSQFKDNEGRLAKLFKSEEELFNEAMNAEIKARKDYDEHLKSL